MKLILILISTFLANNCFAWGLKGQQISVYIAEQLLNPTAKDKINRITNGKPISSYAGWADQVRGSAEWGNTGGWHYINVADPSNYRHEIEAEPKDVADAIEYSVLKFKEAKTDKDKLVWLMFMVHFVGDVHQPLHVGNPADRGGNQVQVRYKKDVNLHYLWDTAFIENRSMSISDYANSLFKDNRSLDELNKKFKVEQVIAENLIHRPFVYSFKNNTIDSNYEKKATEIVNDRLWMGGVRLASILNELFAKVD